MEILIWVTALISVFYMAYVTTDIRVLAILSSPFGTPPKGTEELLGQMPRHVIVSMQVGMFSAYMALVHYVDLYNAATLLVLFMSIMILSAAKMKDIKDRKVFMIVFNLISLVSMITSFFI